MLWTRIFTKMLYIHFIGEIMIKVVLLAIFFSSSVYSHTPTKAECSHQSKINVEENEIIISKEQKKKYRYLKLKAKAKRLKKRRSKKRI